METILEQQRRLHEERDRLINAMVDEFLVKKAAVSINPKTLSKRIDKQKFVYFRLESKSTLIIV